MTDAKRARERNLSQPQSESFFYQDTAPNTYLMATNQAKYVQTGIFLANKAS